MKRLKKKKEIRKGDCFERAYIMLICGSFNDQRPEKYFGEPMLVHGIVWHDNTGRHIHDGLRIMFSAMTSSMVC